MHSQPQPAKLNMHPGSCVEKISYPTIKQQQRNSRNPKSNPIRKRICGTVKTATLTQRKKFGVVNSFLAYESKPSNAFGTYANQLFI
jgi:hypothetical protein